MISLNEKWSRRKQQMLLSHRKQKLKTYLYFRSTHFKNKKLIARLKNVFWPIVANFFSSLEYSISEQPEKGNVVVLDDKKTFKERKFDTEQCNIYLKKTFIS